MKNLARVNVTIQPNTLFIFQKRFQSPFLKPRFSILEMWIIWMSSNMGIISFEPEEELFKSFVQGDGIINNEFIDLKFL